MPWHGSCLANLLYEDGEYLAARQHYRAALAAEPGFAPAHQGLARVLTALGDEAAGHHWQAGFAGHAVVRRRYRGRGTGIPLLLLVSARGGNIPTQHWIDDRIFAVTAVYADFYEPSQILPDHALVVNAIGDADLCSRALENAEIMLAGGTAPVINHSALVRASPRQDNARRLVALPGVIAPDITMLARSAISAADDLKFPLLPRARGFHTGQHFLCVESRHGLADAIASLPGEELLLIAYRDARGSDGMARK
jgi:hypothetical protein